jgi:hypothetical protein
MLDGVSSIEIKFSEITILKEPREMRAMFFGKDFVIRPCMNTRNIL